MEETTNLKIRAKKISELDNFTLDDYDHSFIVIGYNDGSTRKENYKISVSSLLNLFSGSITLDDDLLIDKLNNLFATNQIQLPTIVGPQGPQGEQGPRGAQGPQGIGANVSNELENLQNRINELQNLINRYHNAYTINYNLTNITVRGEKPLSINYGETVTIYFDVNPGYKMPDMISVTGCSIIYNKNDKTLILSNVSSDVSISIIGQPESYSINYTFENINYEIQSNQKSYYNIGENILVLLTVQAGYVLPPVIYANNCSISYQKNINDTSGYLYIECNGTGDMSVHGIAIPNTSYYFGYINILDTNKITVVNEYYPNGEFKGLQSVEVLSTSLLNSSMYCPFDVNSELIIENIDYGDDVILIVPKKYFDIVTKEFITENGQKYKLYPKLFSISSMSFPYSCETVINGIEYYALLIFDQYNGAEYIFK